MNAAPVASAVRTALGPTSAKTARELADALKRPVGSIHRVLRQLAREQAVKVAFADKRKGRYWTATQFQLPI
jgi:hypothetical protein